MPTKLFFIHRFSISVICCSFILFCFVHTAIIAQRPGQTTRQLSREDITKLPPKEKRWALIIGVDKYDDTGITPLRGAANDARILQTALRDHAGFPADQIVLLASDEPKERQPTRVNIMRRLSNLKGLVPPDGLLLVSFSGHGIDRNGSAFLIPSDAAFTEDISLLEETALSVNRIQEQIRATGVGQVLVLLDACRNDPAGGRADSSNPLTDAYVRGFRFNERNKDVEAFATLYATSVGTRAFEYTEKKQGYFTWAVAQGLSGAAANPDSGEVTLRSLVSYVETTVPRQVALDLGPTKKQRPFAVIEGYRADSLVLAIGKATIPKVATTTSLTATAPSAGETAFWDTIKNSSECGDFQAFLAAYPKSTYAVTAQFKSEKLCSLAPASKPQIIEKNESTASPTGSAIATSGLAIQKGWIDLILKSDFRQTIEQTTKALEKNVRDVSAYRMRAVAYYMSGDVENGKKDSNKLLELTNAVGTFETHESRCYAYFSLFRLEEALDACNKAVEANPKSPMGFATRGYVFQNQREYEKSIQDFSKAIELDPDFRWLHREIGVSYYLSKNPVSALAEFDTAISFYPNYDDFYVKRALVFADKKENDKAITDLTKAISLNAKSSISYFNRGLAYNEIRKFDEAIADFAKAIELAPVDFRLYFNRAISASKKGMYKDAIADMSKAIQINPEVSLFYEHRGDYHFWNRNLIEALRDYNEAIRLEPRNSRAYYGRGKVLNAQSEYTKAIDEFTNAIDTDGSNVLAYVERGFMYYIKSKYDLAFADFAKAIELAPQYADPYNRRALIHLWKREFDKAIVDLDQAIKLDPNFGWAYSSRCEAFTGKKQYDKAIEDCSKAITLFPTVSENYRKRAKAYDGKGNSAAAEQDRRKADQLEAAEKKN